MCGSRDKRAIWIAVAVAVCVTLTQAASLEWNPQLPREQLMKKAAPGRGSIPWQKWQLLSLLHRPGAFETFDARTGQQPVPYSAEADDEDIGLDSQDESRKAKQRNKACFFKICSFNTRAL